MNQTARILNIKNYSNIILFEKRASDFESKKKELFKSKVKKMKKLKSAILQKSNKNESFSFPFLSNSTISLFSDINTQLSSRIKQFENSLSDLNKNKNIIKHSQEENKASSNINNIFLTDGIKMYSNRQSSTYNIYNYSNKKKENKTLKNTLNSPNKTCRPFHFTNTNFSKIPNANILIYFQNEKKTINNNENKINETLKKRINTKLLKNTKNAVNFKKIINNKIKLINLKRNNLNECMKETRELQYNEYTSKMIKEHYKRFKENRINKLDYYNDLYNTMENNKKLLNINFIEKLGDYIKYINSQRDLEKGKNALLINDIINIKNEIKQLNNKIGKKIIFKKNILRWIYFQIQLKEKKLILPSYYRTILEKDEISKNINSSSLEKEDNKNIKKEQRKYYSIEIRRSNKFLTKKKLKKWQENEFNSENGLFFNQELDLDNPLNIKEFIRIKNYKKTPIYETVEEFNEIFAFYDNKNIAKMKYFYNLRMDIYYLNLELINIKEKIRQNEIYNDNSIKTKQKELNEIDDSVKFNINLKQKLNKSTNKEIIISNKLNKASLYNMKLNQNQDDDNISLLNKVNILFDTCKLLGLKTDFELNTEKKDKKKSIVNNNFSDILSKLKYITFIIDYLLAKFKIYNSSDNGQKELLNKLKNEIEKNHKIKNAAEQRLQFQKKAIKLRKKLEQRNDKISFLPYRKVDFFNNKKESKNKLKSLDVNKIKKINLDDLLHSD